jgi:hypothetical protein
VGVFINSLRSSYVTAILIGSSLIGIGSADPALRLNAQPVDLRLNGWTARIDPGTLTIHALLDGNPRPVLVATGAAHPVKDIVRTGQSVRWSLPDVGINVALEARANRLHARFDAARDVKLAWPGTGDDPRMSALILPDGEGLYLPLADAAWRRRLAGQCFAAQSGLSMPFWSYAIGGRTFTYLALSDIRTELCMGDTQGHLSAQATHTFLARDGNAPYELEIWPGAASPIAPALEYRAGLMAAGQFVTLAEKIHRNPEVAKLAGAIHMYVSGDGRTPEFIDDLRALGVHKAFIGYDQDEQTPGARAGASYVAAAKAAGYLIGPYDSFSNAQDPKHGDQPSRWPAGLYKAGCIVNQQGRIVAGFAGRGCELSSEALERAASNPVAGRVAAWLRTGVNAYFLDVDAFGELYDDYSPAHPMTQFQDRANRLKRMRYVRDRGVVLGSEEGVAWSVPLIHFAHGAFSVQNSALWPKQRSKEFGAWWPPERPGIFFQPVDPGAEFRAAKYDPLYRIPLYEAAFHDAVVATDRWDVPLTKFPRLMKTRQQLELLYGVPSMWAMDRRQLRDARPVLVKLLPFFEAEHSRIATLPLTSFEWLTPDRTVQRTQFGIELTLTSNFGAQTWNGIPAGYIQTRWLSAGRKELSFP